MSNGIPPPIDPGRYGPSLDALPILAWTAGPDGRLEYLNRRCLEYAGLPLDDLLGWDWGWVVHPDDLPGTLAVWAEAIRTGTPLVIDQRLRRHDGQYRWFATRATAVRDGSGAVVRWFGTGTDIDAAKRAEHALRATGTLFRALVERSADGYVLIGADHTIRYASPGVTGMLGHLNGVLTGTTACDWVHPDDRKRLREALDDLLAGSQVEVEARLRHRDGGYRRVAARTTNLLPDPDVRGLAVTFREVGGAAG